MSVFQIKKENGYSRSLQSKDNVRTPFLIKSVNSNSEFKISQIVLTEKGLLRLPSNLTEFMEDLDYYIADIPNWSVLLPKLTPEVERLAESLEYEYTLFLERLSKYELPNAFGFSYNPDMSPQNYLERLLGLNPSFIAIKIENPEKMSARRLIDRILKIREKIPPNIAIYLSGGAPVGFQSILFALGIDIFDDNSAYRLASNHKSFYDGVVEHKFGIIDYADLIETNLKELYRDFEGVQYHFNNNTLWTRIARDMHSHPNVASIVSILKNEELDQLLKISSKEKNQIVFTGEEGLYHPDIVKYRKTVLDTYNLPIQKKILILLPCSAKKPYVESKSHRFFMKAIRKAGSKYIQDIAVWSLTSPLGVVPRELETIFPARSYDLPVTGDWSIEESRITGNLLHDMLTKIPDNIEIIVHVSKGYEQMVNVGLRDKTYYKSWIDSRPSSFEALDQLKDILNPIIEKLDEESKLNQDKEFKKKKFMQIAVDTISSIVKYNHGNNVDLPLDDIILQGKPPRPIQVRSKNGQHYLSWNSIYGTVGLSPQAASNIANQSTKWVQLDSDQIIGSSIFGVGVIKASDEISPNDEVFVLSQDKKKLIGIGHAIMSGKSMNKLSSGIFVKMKKKCDITLEGKV